MIIVKSWLNNWIKLFLKLCIRLSFVWRCQLFLVYLQGKSHIFKCPKMSKKLVQKSWWYGPKMAEALELSVGATFSQHSKQQKVAQTILRLFCTSQSSLCACWWALHQFLLAQWVNGPPGCARPALWYKRWVCQSCHPLVSKSPNWHGCICKTNESMDERKAWLCSLM